MDLLEKKRVLLIPGSGFNVPYTDHFRITLLPDEGTLRDVLGRIEELLDEQAREGA
jgi:alanine-synthesizing transaminase